jgi:hypothetical protein
MNPCFFWYCFGCVCSALFTFCVVQLFKSLDP